MFAPRLFGRSLWFAFALIIFFIVYPSFLLPWWGFFFFMSRLPDFGLLAILFYAFCFFITPQH
jgi:hypothetical protein